MSAGWLRSALLALAALEGGPVFLVGGCLRDRLLGRPIRDVDVAVAGDPRALGESLARQAGGSSVLLDADPVLVRLAGPDGSHLDIAGLRGGSIDSDLRHRDLTMNALAAPLGPGLVGWLLGDTTSGPVPPLLDPSGGQSDLSRRALRAVSDEAFRDDPVRLLRAVRFRAELGFSIVPETLALMRRDAALAARPAAERVRDELAALLAPAGALDHLRLLDSLGILCLLLPELASLRGLAQSGLHQWDAFEHSLHAVPEIEWVCAWMAGAAADNPGGRRLAPTLREWLKEALPGGHSRSVLLKLAALLHDVGKPPHRTVEAGGRVRFIGHAETGAELAGGAMRRLRFSAREAEAVRRTVACHMRPPEVAASGGSGRAVYRFYRDAGDDGVGVLLLSLADHRATRGPDLEEDGWRRHVEFTWAMLSAWWETPAEQVAPPRLVTGDDLMSELGLPAGPAVGRALEAIREAQAQGEVRTRAEALALASKVAS